jgi:pimeloyl-ACP methyl ester carboxylesterase
VSFRHVATSIQGFGPGDKTGAVGLRVVGPRGDSGVIAQHFEVGTLERGLPQLRMPALIVHGDTSPLPYTEAERTAALIPGARLRILPGIGHVAWLERPGSVRREMEALLGQD